MLRQGVAEPTLGPRKLLSAAQHFVCTPLTALIAHKKFSIPENSAPSQLSNLTRLTSMSQGCKICNQQTPNCTGRKVFHKVHAGAALWPLLGSLELRANGSAAHRRDINSLLFVRTSTCAKDGNLKSFVSAASAL